MEPAGPELEGGTSDRLESGESASHRNARSESASEDRERTRAASTRTTRTESPSESNPDISEEDVFEVLSNRRRRYALHCLVESGETDLGDLAERVAAWENDKPVEELATAERKRVYCALQQSHLPKMDGAGVVSFDKQRGTIEPNEVVEQLDVYVDVVRGDEIPWSKYYVGLSALGGALVLALWVGAAPFAWLPDVAWAAFLTAMFGTSAVVHHYHARKTRLGVGGRPPDADGE